MFKDFLLASEGGLTYNMDRVSDDHRAALLIGVGGSGIEVLRYVRHFLEGKLAADPTDRNKKSMRVPGIGYAAIDRCNDSLQALIGSDGFSMQECFSLNNPNLPAMLASGQWKNMDEYRWMLEGNKTIPSTQELLNSRAAGRFALIQKSNDVKHFLNQMIMHTLHESNRQSLDIHIFAGLAGNTGSSCILDLCYILRDLLKNRQGSIHAYLIFPDLILKKFNISTSSPFWRQSYTNACASMKEIDHYMKGAAAGKCYKQNYGSFYINSDQAPMDTCTLFSGMNGNSKKLEVSLDSICETISEYLLRQRSEYAIPPTKGYRILGARTAQVPAAQMLTYLVGEHFLHMSDTLLREAATESVTSFANYAGLTPTSLYQMISEDILMEPDYNMSLIQSLSKLNSDAGSWNKDSNAVNEAIQACILRAENMINHRVSSNMEYMDQLIHELKKSCMDPKHGPGQISDMICCDGQPDLSDLLTEIIQWAQNERSAHTMSTDRIVENICHAAEEYNHAAFRKKRAMKQYLETVNAYVKNKISMRICEGIERYCIILRTDINKANARYFLPLKEAMTSLKSAAISNREWINTSANAHFRGRDCLIDLHLAAEQYRAELFEDYDSEAEMEALIQEIFSREREWVGKSSSELQAVILDHLKSKVNSVFFGFIDKQNKMMCTEEGTRSLTEAIDQLGRDAGESSIWPDSRIQSAGVYWLMPKSMESLNLTERRDFRNVGGLVYMSGYSSVSCISIWKPQELMFYPGMIETAIHADPNMRTVFPIEGKMIENVTQESMVTEPAKVSAPSKGTGPKRKPLVPPKAYQGDQPFIFISYSHKDRRKVWPMIHKMQRDGYHVWYDDGINPVEDWDEVVSNKVLECSLLIAILTDNYIESINCLDELAYARNNDKDLALIYLRKVSLPPKLEMRMGLKNAIRLWDFMEEESFYNKIYSIENIDTMKE